jgi:hypothetical protein
MALFDLNTGARDNVVCNLQWEWEVPITELGISIFVVPKAFVKGEVGRKTDRVLVCNTVAQSIIERQRGKHDTHVFVYRRERIKNINEEANRWNISLPSLIQQAAERRVTQKSSNQRKTG